MTSVQTILTSSRRYSIPLLENGVWSSNSGGSSPVTSASQVIAFWNPTSSLNLKRERLILTHFNTLSSMSISLSFIASKTESLVFILIVSSTSQENWVSSWAIRATQSESYDEIPLTCRLYSTYPVAVELCPSIRFKFTCRSLSSVIGLTSKPWASTWAEVIKSAVAPESNRAQVLHHQWWHQLWSQYQ